MIRIESFIDVFPVTLALKESVHANALTVREAIIGSSTLPTRTIVTLGNILRNQDISWNVILHSATKSAAETQSVLPRDVTVMKTVTVRVGKTIFLYSSLGDVHIDKSVVKAVAKLYQLSSRETRRFQINPPEIDPETAYNMTLGMVSPFLSANHTIVRAVICAYAPCKYVAISLSLWESLIVPYTHIHDILARYAKKCSATYPHLIFSQCL